MRRSSMTEPAIPRTVTRRQGRRNWPAQGAWTYEDYVRLPDDGNRYEVIRGVLYVTPSPVPEHQFSSAELVFQLSAFVRQNHLGLVLAAPLAVKLPRGIATPVEPDVMFFRKGNGPRWDLGYYEGVPDLLAEILSPRTSRRDQTVKLQAYLDAGVPEYWLVDPRARTVVVYVLEKGKYVELVRGGVGDEAWSSVLPGFRLNVSDLFASLTA
jgi:Uma2 family endonuclease